MADSFGTSIKVTLFGESHGPLIGAVLEGLPSGFEIDLEKLEKQMDRRKARGSLSTKRHESDKVEIVSGFFEGKTTGTALTLIIRNENTRSGDYTQTKYRLRPGHADYTAFEKYHGFQDYRGGGHFSGRLTAAIVAAGAICRQLLEVKNIKILSHIIQLYDVTEARFPESVTELEKAASFLENSEFPVLDEEVSIQMQKTIEEAAAQLDSVGGIVESAILHVPTGIGEPFFDSIESELAHLIFSIPAVKGLSFGTGFGFAGMKGSQANDAFVMDQEDKNIITKTNHNGGINGGISNGMPILLETVIKPTPSIFQKQETVDYLSRQQQTLQIKGRHDPAIIHRAVPVIESMIAIGLLDLMFQACGKDNFL